MNEMNGAIDAADAARPSLVAPPIGGVPTVRLTMPPRSDSSADSSADRSTAGRRGAGGDRSGSACLPGERLADWPSVLARLAPDGDDAGRIDQIRLLEEIKAGCAAAQARITAVFAASQRAAAPVGPEGIEGEEIRKGTVEGSAARRAAQLRAKAQRLANRSAAAQVALARRESPQRGGRFVGLADALTREMPNTLAALASGVIGEWRAMIIVRETACLSGEERRQVDAEIAGRLEGLGDARVEALVRAVAYRIDPNAATARAVKAAADRRLSLRPAPDAMGYLTALMPVASAVACYAALCRYVDTRPPIDGDVRTRDQRIIDEYVVRLTGGGTAAGLRDSGDGAAVVTARQEAGSDREGSGSTSSFGSTRAGGVGDDPIGALRASYQRAMRRDAERSHAVRADGGLDAVGQTCGELPARDAAPRDPVTAHDFPAGVDVVINVVMTDRALLAGGDDPAVLPGNHPIPAPLARRMIADLPPHQRLWIRRLYTRPDTGELVAAESRGRLFPPALRRLLFTRDQTCRTPWCNAPARHADHLAPAADGGPTSLQNGQALSEDCNYIRTAPGWSARRDPERPGGILVTTPTGHSYPSPCPDLIPGHTRHVRPEIEVHHSVEQLLEWQLTAVG